MTNKIRKALLASLLSMTAFCAYAQKTVTGTVRDASGEPMIGVTIMADGKAGAITDIDGNFSIPNATESTQLTISYIGYKEQTVSVGNQSRLNIVMQEDNQALDEVVVVGYGTMKKSDLTGSVSSLSTEDITAKGAATVMEGLQGAVPGVNITKSSGRAGGEFDIEIRGKSSTNSNTKPIYVVDGMICDNIDFLNQQDIERVDVLKDASSTAIYGSRATAGVIMVTTKSGAGIGNKTQKPTISYDGYYGFSKIARMPEFQTGRQFYDYRFVKFLSSAPGQSTAAAPGYVMGNYNQMALVRTNDDPSTSVLKELLAAGGTTDWADLATRNGSQQNHYIAISGATDKTSYHFGLGYNEEKGIYEGDRRDQFSFKGSVDAKINKVFSAGFNVNLAYIRNSYANDDAIELAYRMNPFAQPYSRRPDERNGYIYDANGNIPGEGYTGYYYNEDGKIYKNYAPGSSYAMGTDDTGHNFSNSANPLYSMDAYTHKRQTWRALGNVYLQINPVKGLTIKSTFSPNFSFYRDGSFTDVIRDYAGGLVVGAENSEGEIVNHATLATARDISYTWDNVVTYDNVFAEKHALNVMGLFSMTANDSEDLEQAAFGVLNGSQWYNLASGTFDGTNTSNAYSENSMVSYALRANYVYDERYMLTATVRWDGSSKFEKGNRWGCFPSVAAAWRASQEKFLRDVKWLSNLKLRLSYGVTGNNTGVGNYATRTTVAGGSVYYPFGSSYVTAFYPNAIVDRDITWETSKEINFGIDFGFFRNRLSGSIDIYKKNSEDLLYEVTLPLEAGVDDGGDPMRMYTNVGEVENKGIEFTLTGIPVDTKDWYWDITASFARNINKVKEINGSGSDLPNDGLFVGRTINNVYGYNWIGIVSDREMTVPDTEIAVAKGLVPGTTMKEYEYYNICYGLQEGNPKIEDVNGDGAITDADKKVFRSDPAWTGSLTTTLKYKNWDLSASLYTKQNYKVYADFLASNLDYRDRGWMHLDVDYYIPAGTLIDCDGIAADGTYINPVYQQTTHYGAYPFPNEAGTSNGLNGSSKAAFSREGEQCQAITDASFVKVKYITLGYTFPKKWMSKVGISSLRLYCTVTNPFVWTDYKGFDPEWAGGGAENDGPSTVTWEFGASLKF